MRRLRATEIRVNCFRGAEKKKESGRGRKNYYFWFWVIFRFLYAKSISRLCFLYFFQFSFFTIWCTWARQQSVHFPGFPAFPRSICERLVTTSLGGLVVGGSRVVLFFCHPPGCQTLTTQDMTVWLRWQRGKITEEEVEKFPEKIQQQKAVCNL